MKLSEYIKQLTRILDENGDIECVEWIEDMDEFEGVYKPYEADLKDRLSDYAYTYLDDSGVKQYANINWMGYFDGVKEKVLVISEEYK